MKLSVDCKQFVQALTTVSNVTGSDHVSLSCSRKRGTVNVASAKDGKTVVLTVPCAIEDDSGKCTVPVAIMTAILPKTGSVSLDIDDSQMNFKAASKGKRQDGNIAVLPHEAVKIEEADGDSVEIGKDTLQYVAKHLPMVSINNVYTEDTLYLLVKQTKKYVAVCVYDNFHFAYCRSDNLKGDAVEFGVPRPVWDTISQLAAGDEFTLYVADSRVFAKGEKFYLSVPKVESVMPQSVSTFEDSLLESIPKSSDGEFLVELDELQEVVRNCSAIADEGIAATFSAKDKKVKVHFKTSFGELNTIMKAEEVKWKQSAEFNLEPHLLSDVLASVPSKDVRIEFVSGKFMYFVCSKDISTLYYGCTMV